MIRNICKISFRSLSNSEMNFTEINISHSENKFEITEEDPDPGKLYIYKLSAKLKQKAFYRYDGLQFDVVFSDGTHIFVGNNDFPSFLNTKEDLDFAEITVDWKDIYPPNFLPVS